jgi:hypothetical protein
MSTNPGQISLFGEGRQRFSLPTDYEPVCPDYMDVSQIFLN